MAARVTVTLLRWCLCVAVIPTASSEIVGGDLEAAEVQLAGGPSEREGRVLLRWPAGGNATAAWTAVCHDPSFPGAAAYLVCRRLGYPFVCGQRPAGSEADAGRLGPVDRRAFRARCRVLGREDGGCVLSADADLMSSCRSVSDWWLACGTADMPSFELRLVGATYRQPAGLLQGRCGPDFEWGAICGNTFYEQRQGRVVCRQLGLSDQAISLERLWPGKVGTDHGPATNYTLFADVGCYGHETSLTQCLHFGLQECSDFVRVECFTELTDYEPTAYLCGSKQLCIDSCRQLHPIGSQDDRFHYCQCDPACRLFDDCCPDHAASCLPGEPTTGLPGRGEFALEDFECVWPLGSQLTYTGYLSVARCPDEWADRGTRELCEQAPDGREEDVLAALPVFDGLGVDFKNVFCALCHGRALEELTRWNVTAVLETGVLFIVGAVPPPGTRWLITPPVGHQALRSCPAHLVETCLTEHRGSPLEAACRAYYAPVKLEGRPRRYRNPHCALCNGEVLSPQTSCAERVCSVGCAVGPWAPCIGVCSPLDELLTIEILFDFKASGNPVTGASCRHGEIYDPFRRRCRALTCAAGYQLDGDQCVAAPSTLPPTTNSSDPEQDACLASVLTEAGLGQPGSFTVTSGPSPETNASSAAFILVRSGGLAGDVESTLDGVLQGQSGKPLPNATSPLPCNASEVWVVLLFSFNGSQACNGFRTVASDVYAGSSGQLLRVATYQAPATGQQVHTKERAPPHCLKVGSLNCSTLLTLEESEFSLSQEGALRVTVTGQVISSADHVVLPDGRAVVCSYLRPEEEDVEAAVRRILAFVGSLVSLVALAATFATYCALRELRNVAGVATMNLVGALFTALLTFLVAGALGGSAWACALVAALAHLAWLAAFAWMALLSFNVARTVASMVPAARGRSPGLDRTTVAFLGLGWGAPLAVVAVCLALHLGSAALYAENGVCWITDVTARIVAFLVPMAACLVLSLGFYVFAIVTLRRTRRNTRAARNQGKAEAAKQELAVYAKLSTVVGVTWLLGFVSQSVTGLVVFSYLYILLNYLQGLFIFVAFCLNRRVRGMWRDKLGPWRGGRGPAGTSATSAAKQKDTATLTGKSRDSTTETKI